MGAMAMTSEPSGKWSMEHNYMTQLKQPKSAAEAKKQQKEEVAVNSKIRLQGRRFKASSAGVAVINTQFDSLKSRSTRVDVTLPPYLHSSATASTP